MGGQTNPRHCKSWSGVNDLTVSENGCDALCGSNHMQCSPAPTLIINDEITSMNNECRGEFSKIDYMNVYQSDSGYLWFQENDTWKCTDSLPRCDGSGYSVFSQISSSLMDNYTSCDLHENVQCVGTGQRFWA